MQSLAGPGWPVSARRDIQDVLPVRLYCKLMILNNIHSPQGMFTPRLAKAAVKARQPSAISGRGL